METLSQFVSFIGSHFPIVKLITAILAGACGAVILYLRKEAVSAERWAKYFGCGFLIYAMQYLLQVVAGYWNSEDLARAFAVLGSSLNNLFFLASACALLGKKRLWPRWAPIAAFIGLVAILPPDEYSWSRLPDSIFSAYCLGSVGYAASTNIGFRLRRRFTLTALLVAGLYAFIQIAYGLNPLQAYEGWPLPSRWLKTLLNISDPKAMLNFLDAFDIALVLPLKFGLFFLAFYLLIQAIVVVSSSSSREMLEGILNGRLEYLSGEGIAKSIGQNIKADVVELSLLLPGRSKKRMAIFKWDKEAEPRSEPEIKQLPSPEESVVGMVLKRGMEVRWPNSHRGFAASLFSVDDTQSKTPLVAVPIRFHGAIIGCLSAEWKTGRSFSETAVQHLRDLAGLVSPAVQSYREVAALDQLSYRFTRWQIEQLKVVDEDGVQVVADILHDILSPLATDVTMDFGFRRLRGAKSEKERYSYILQKEPGDEVAEAIVGFGEECEIIRSRLVITRMNKGDNNPSFLQIGNLALVIRSERDELERPTLATNYIYRRTVGAVVADALLDIVREHFTPLLKDFGVRLNS
jgi:hypothetical protein